MSNLDNGENSDIAEGVFSDEEMEEEVEEVVDEEMEEEEAIEDAAATPDGLNQDKIERRRLPFSKVQKAIGLFEK